MRLTERWSPDTGSSVAQSTRHGSWSVIGSIRSALWRTVKMEMHTASPIDASPSWLRVLQQVASAATHSSRPLSLTKQRCSASKCCMVPARAARGVVHPIATIRHLSVKMPHIACRAHVRDCICCIRTAARAGSVALVRASCEAASQPETPTTPWMLSAVDSLRPSFAQRKSARDQHRMRNPCTETHRRPDVPRWGIF